MAGSREYDLSRPEPDVPRGNETEKGVSGAEGDARVGAVMRFSNRGNHGSNDDGETRACARAFIKVPVVTRPLRRSDRRLSGAMVREVSSLIQINRFMHRRDLERRRKKAVPRREP